MVGLKNRGENVKDPEPEKSDFLRSIIGPSGRVHLRPMVINLK